jgi:large subunit ribosomal protein L25
LIDLEIGKDKPVKALIQDIQYEPVSDKIRHIDFRQIKADEKVSVEVGIKFIGESSAIKELGGVLVHGLDKVHIECLPDDLIHEIEIDISLMKNFGDSIRIKDLALSNNKIKVLNDPDVLLIQVEEPKVEEEVVVEATSAEPERIGEKEKAEAGVEAGAKTEKDNKEKK